MAYTTINKPSLFFTPKLYTGNDTANTTISGVGFQSDLTWIKSRLDTENQHLFDSVRGGGNRIYPNLTAANSYVSTTLTSWNSNGFVVGEDDGVNKTNGSFASWNWKAGTTGSGTTSGSGTGKPYSYSVNTTSKCSIVKYVGNATAGHTIPHHLGVAPTCIILKRYDGGTTRWFVYFAVNGNKAFLELNTNDTMWGNRDEWNSTTPTSSVFSLGNQTDVNGDGSTYIAYCFADVAGYSKFSSYTGNGNANGTFEYLGFKPAYVMIKNNTVARNWGIWDNKRLGFNPSNSRLHSDTNGAEETNPNIDLMSNGFKLRDTDGDTNTNAKKYVYMAFAEEPLVGSNNVPATAR